MIFKAILEAFQNNLPFVVFKKPNTETIIGYFQNNDTIDVWEKEKSGFVFHTFKEETTVFFDNQNCKVLEENHQQITREVVENNLQKSTINKNQFTELVAKTVETIMKNNYEKIVVSAVEILETNNFDAENTFKNILNTYQSAFCYWFFHPKIGQWMGASPELLLKKENQTISTISLAGTQLYAENIIWKNKELEEQNIVTNYIKNILEPYCKTIELGKTENQKAGKLVHLKTTISADLKDENTVFQLVNDLHPTPAVAGLPKIEALQFILENENYDRKYYTGFLGEWNINQENTTFFVNLRCMEITPNAIKLYVGCGVTKDSIPENEYLEISNKTTTMKNILKFM